MAHEAVWQRNQKQKAMRRRKWEESRRREGQVKSGVKLRFEMQKKPPLPLTGSTVRTTVKCRLLQWPCQTTSLFLSFATVTLSGLLDKYRSVSWTGRRRHTTRPSSTRPRLTGTDPFLDGGERAVCAVYGSKNNLRGGICFMTANLQVSD